MNIRHRTHIKTNNLNFCRSSTTEDDQQSTDAPTIMIM